MPIGPGRYDAECTAVREGARAEGAIVIVFNGARGTGFSMQASPALTATVPDILRRVAADIESSLQRGRL